VEIEFPQVPDGEQIADQIEGESPNGWPAAFDRAPSLNPKGGDGPKEIFPTLPVAQASVFRAARI
jgi:hypothetical protein